MKTLLLQNETRDTVLHQCLCESLGEVGVCRNLQQVQQPLSLAPFALVVVDLDNLVARNESLTWLRSQPGANGRFVLVGVQASELERSLQLLRTGVDDILVKPYEPVQVRIRLAAVARQIERRIEFRRKEEELSTRAQQQVAIAALGQCALSEDLGTLIDMAGWFILTTLDVQLWDLSQLSEDGRSIEIVAGFGWPAGYLGQVRARSDARTLPERTLQGEDMIVRELDQDDQGHAPEVLRNQGVTSAISVGVRGKTKNALGVLVVYSTRPRDFVDDDLRFLQGVANVLGTTIQRQRSQAEIERHQSQVQHLQRLESVGQLAAGLAHDYNNVLTIIQGHLTLALGHSQLPTKVAGSLKIAVDAVERAANLTRQLLSFSRKQSLSPQPIDLNAVIISMARLLDRVLGGNIRLELEEGPDLPAIYADGGMLDQVLMNLGVNARDAMPEGGLLRIGTSVVNFEPGRVKLHPEARPGEFVCLSVTDTGCGMDEATLRRIYDPFFTTKQPDKGTGLGLSTVYGIVKQHQGWIEVVSAPGKGTTFRVFFPSLSEAPARPAAPAREVSGPDAHPHATILLVEDEPKLRQLARLLLENLGYDVLEAESGREALRVWGEHKVKIHVLLTDVVMADGLTGFELAEKLHEDSPTLKTIFTSGYNADDIEQNLPSEGGFHFVQKPYRTESLARALRECLGPANGGA